MKVGEALVKIRISVDKEPARVALCHVEDMCYAQIAQSGLVLG